MVTISLKRPHCGSENIGKFGQINGKQRYACNNEDCEHKTFYAEYKYNGCKPEVKREIAAWSVDGAGIRAISRRLGISTDAVISELKKRRKDRIHKQRIF